MKRLQHTSTNKALRGLLAVAGLLAATVLSGCLMGGYSSAGGGHFFLFPSLGVILVIIVLFALLRRR